MEKKLKIIISINTSWNIYNFRKGLVKALLSKGHKIYTVAPEDKHTSQLVAWGCHHIPVTIENKGSNPLKDMALMYRYYKIFRKVQPDVILQYTIKPNVYGTLAAKLAGIPTVNNVSGLGTVFLHDNLVSKVAKKLYKVAFRYPYHIFFQNNDDRDLFIKCKLVRSGKCSVVPGSGIDIGHYTPINPESDGIFRFLLIARLLYDKGVVEYVESAREILKTRNSVKFLLLGEIDEKANLGVSESLVEQWQKDNIIEYLGTSSDVRLEISQADCIVLPSYREGTPKSLLEGAAMGKPLITTDAPGCREVVDHNYNGYLCQVKDAASLRDSMIKMIDLSGEEREQLGKNSREKVMQSFREEIVINKYIAIIDKIYTK